MTEGVRLGHDELECLRRILANPDSLPETCRESAVQHLLNLGLVERVLLLALPVILPRYGYRITERGRHALHAVE